MGTLNVGLVTGAVAVTSSVALEMNCRIELSYETTDQIYTEGCHEVE